MKRKLKSILAAAFCAVGLAAFAVGTHEGAIVRAGLEESPTVATVEELDALVVPRKSYVNTGYVPNHLRTMVEVSATAAAQLDGVALFCANARMADPSSEEWKSYYAHFDGDVTFENLNSDFCVDGLAAPATNTPFVIRYFRNTITLDGTTYTGETEVTEDAAAGSQLCLFCSYQSTRTEWFEGSVKYVKIWEVTPDNTETNLVMDLVPARAPGGGETLYDKNSGRYLTMSPTRWTGAGEDGKWSDEANWTAGVPSEFDAVEFTNETQRVNLDVDATVDNFFVAANKKATFYNADAEKTNTLTVLNMYMLGQGGSVVEFEGENVAFNAPKGKDYSYSKATVIATDGAKFAADVLNYGDNGGQRLIAKGAGSSISVGTLTLLGWDGNPDESLEAYDGGSVSIANAAKPQSAFTVIATNCSTSIGAMKLDLTTAKAHKVTVDGSYVFLGSFAGGANAAVRVGGDIVGSEGCLNFQSSFNMANGNYTQTLTLDGAGPEIIVMGNSTTTLGKKANPDKLTVKLVPELLWSATTARVRKESNKGTNPGSSAKFTLADGVKFNIDCKAFAAYFGKKTMALFSQMNSSGASYTVPAASRVTLKGDGSENCAASFSSDSKKFYLTIAAKNAPEGKVAAVNVGDENSVYYDTLQEALAEAPAGADVVLIQSVELGEEETLAASNKIKLYALDPLTITGVIDTTNITLGENVTNVVRFTVSELTKATLVVSNGTEQLEEPYSAPIGSDVIVTYTAAEGFVFAETALPVNQVTVAAKTGELTTGVSDDSVVSADSVLSFWTGAATEDTKWSTAANWKDEKIPAPAGIAIFQSDAEVTLDGASTRDNPLAKFLLVDDDATVAFDGGQSNALYSSFGEFGIMGDNATLAATGKGTFVDVRVDKGAVINNNDTFMAKDGAYLRVGKFRWPDMERVAFRALGADDEGTPAKVEISAFGTLTSGQTLSVVATNGVFESNSYTIDNGILDVSLGDGGSAKFLQFVARDAASVFRIGADSTLSFRCNSAGFQEKFPSGTIFELSGSSPRVEFGGEADIEFNAGVVFKLAPDASWAADGRIVTGTYCGLKTVAGVKYEIDLSALGELTEPKTFGLFKTGDEAIEFTLPAADDVTVLGVDPDKYEVTFEIVEGLKSDDKTKVLNTVNVTIAPVVPVYDITIVAPENGTLETSVTNGIAEGTEVTVTATPAENYELEAITVDGVALDEGVFTFTMPASNVTVAATFKSVKQQGWSEDPTQDQGKTVAEVYPELKDSVFANVDAGSLGAWAKERSIDFDAFVAGPDEFKDAFLLDCDPEGVEDEAAKFVFVSIRQLDDGSWAVLVTDDTPDGSDYKNGVVKVMRYSDVTCETPADEGNFFKASLELKTINE